MNLEVSEELKYGIVHKTKKPKISLRYFRDDSVYKITLQSFPLWNPDLAKKLVLVTSKFVWYVGISMQLSFAGQPLVSVRGYWMDQKLRIQNDQYAPAFG